MDIINSTGIHTEYRVLGTWRSLAARDYAFVRPSQEGPWKVELRVPGGQPIAKVVSSPKASVVLQEEAGQLRVQVLVAGIDALIIYAPSIREWAEKLDATLLNTGLSTWIDYRDLKVGPSAWDQLEEVILQVKNIVVLAGPRDDRTDRQRIVGSVSLKGVYESAEKRMIPLLLGDAKLPVFVRAAAHWTGRPIPSIRITDPARDWDRAIADLIEILKGEVDPRAKGEVIDTAEEDRRLRQERMEYLRQVIDEMKIQEDQARLERPSAKSA